MRLAQRAAWLAGVTLVAAIVGLAISRRGGETRPELPAPVTVPGTKSGWYSARAAPYGPTARHRRTACGEQFTTATEGVAHPVLPCGVKLYVRFHGREVLTEVVDRGPYSAGRDLDLTKALANRLDLHGTQVIQWRFAR